MVSIHFTPQYFLQVVAVVQHMTAALLEKKNASEFVSCQVQ